MRANHLAWSRHDGVWSLTRPRAVSAATACGSFPSHVNRQTSARQPSDPGERGAGRSHPASAAQPSGVVAGAMTNSRDIAHGSAETGHESADESV